MIGKASPSYMQDLLKRLTANNEELAQQTARLRELLVQLLGEVEQGPTTTAPPIDRLIAGVLGECGSRAADGCNLIGDLRRQIDRVGEML
jgi:hypothetical protein